MTDWIQSPERKRGVGKAPGADAIARLEIVGSFEDFVASASVQSIKQVVTCTTATPRWRSGL